ncbi:MAG TPA: metal ABC transporter permease [Thermoleophilaceae bacterium]
MEGGERTLMFGHEFMRNAFLAGTFVALACGLVGYFVVLRAQVFAGDALSHVAFTGALAAAAAGIDLRIGLFAITILVALGMGLAGDRARPDDVVIGSFFAWILGLGALFLSIYTTSSSGSGDGTAGVRVLFGSIFGLSASEARLAALLGAAAVALTLVIARPLLFSSVDVDVAEAKGLKVRTIGLVFLGVLGLTAAEATQAVGALLLLGLLAAPAGAAHRLTANPYKGLALSAALAILATWGGLTLSYLVPDLPPSSMIILLAVAIYLAASLATQRARKPKLESVR